MKKHTPQARSGGQAASKRRLIVGGIGGVALLGMVTAFATAPSTEAPRLELQTVVETLATSTTAPISSEGTTFLHEELIQRSDTVSSLFNRLGIADREALEFIRLNETAQAVSRQLRRIALLGRCQADLLGEIQLFPQRCDRGFVAGDLRGFERDCRR